MRLSTVDSFQVLLMKAVCTLFAFLLFLRAYLHSFDIHLFPHPTAVQPEPNLVSLITFVDKDLQKQV